MAKRLNRSNLQVSETLVNFIENDALPNTNVSAERFWNKLELILDHFAPLNKRLLETRSEIKKQIDSFYKDNSGKTIDQNLYINFLKKINYIVPVGNDFTIETQNVDPELAQKAGPQLVVPVTNARYALNAANARWGSLYDALYGTDAISEDGNAKKTNSYNPSRGKKVVEYGRGFLDKYFELDNGSHMDVNTYEIVNGNLLIKSENSIVTKLRDSSQYVGYQGSENSPECVLLKNNNLHVEILINN